MLGRFIINIESGEATQETSWNFIKKELEKKKTPGEKKLFLYRKISDLHEPNFFPFSELLPDKENLKELIDEAKKRSENNIKKLEAELRVLDQLEKIPTEEIDKSKSSNDKILTKIGVKKIEIKKSHKVAAILSECFGIATGLKDFDKKFCEIFQHKHEFTPRKLTNARQDANLTDDQKQLSDNIRSLLDQLA